MRLGKQKSIVCKVSEHLKKLEHGENVYKIYVAISRVDNLTYYSSGWRLLEFKFVSDDSLRLFRYAAKIVMG